MPIRSDDPLRRTTLNLYEADCKAMLAYYGRGWTEEVRRLVHEHITTANSSLKVRRTLGDMETTE